MSGVLHIDFETRSACDLKKANAYIYFDDPTTDIWCAAYSFGGEPELWVPGEPCPPEIVAHIETGGLIAAWNAQFERLAWRTVLARKYGWPVPKLEQYRCVMAQAYAMGLPGKLEDSAHAMHLPERKDVEGHRIMLQLSKPRRPRKGEDPNGIYWWDDQEKIAKLFSYCRQDVRTEMAVHDKLPPLQETELQTWFLDQRINDRGVHIDKKLCEASEIIVKEASEALDDEMRRVTDYAVRGVSNVAELIGFVKKHGIDAESVAKDQIINLLIRDDLPPAVRRALEIRQEGSKTSTAKIQAMLARRQKDGNMRGNLQYHGAGPGRWAARGAQLQNLPRPKFKGDINTVIGDVLKFKSAKALEVLHGSPMQLVSDIIRGMVCASPGKKIMSRDFSSIEARVTAWLAGEKAKLDVFRKYDAKLGPDPYIVAAAGIYNVPTREIDKEDPRRQVGKVSELALGFGGGPAAFQAMAKNYAVDIGGAYETVWASASPENREAALEAWPERGKRTGMSQKNWITAECVKLAWRQSNPRITAFWRETEDAAIDAVLNPGKVTQSGLLRFRKAGSWLLCRLPSGRTNAYAYPRVVEKPTPWNTTSQAVKFWGVDSFTKKWSEQDSYGGFWVQNAVQGTARDVMRDAMLRAEHSHYPVVLTVHDEIVAEVDRNFGDSSTFSTLVTTIPPWAQGLPIVADGWEGPRYRK